MNTLYLCPSGLSLKIYLERNEKNFTSKGVEVFLRESSDETLMEGSAELNSLFRMGVSGDDRIILLSSDTDDGEMIAKALAKALKQKKKCNAEVKRISGLQTDDRKKFEQTGITNLSEIIIDEIEKNRWQYHVVLNATAGFKATVPYLTFIGMIFNVPIRYIFERSESIIDLPPIPIVFDLERLKRLEPVIDKITSDYIPLDEFTSNTGFSYEDMEQYTGDILLKEDGLVTLRPTGRILYRRYLQLKGNKVYLSQAVTKKLETGSYNRKTFEALFRKMKDPVHLQSKLHSDIKKQGKVDLECYKAGDTSERIFFYTGERAVYICDIYMHDEYERAITQGGLLKEKYEKQDFKEIQFDNN